MARTRFPGGSEDLVTILSPHVRSPFWLKYSEADNVSEAVTDLTAICKHNGLLKELQKNLPESGIREKLGFCGLPIYQRNEVED